MITPRGDNRTTPYVTSKLPDFVGHITSRHHSIVLTQYSICDKSFQSINQHIHKCAEQLRMDLSTIINHWMLRLLVMHIELEKIQAECDQCWCPISLHCAAVVRCNSRNTMLSPRYNWFRLSTVTVP